MEKQMISLKKNEYVDHYKRPGDDEVYICLVLEDGTYHGLLERE